MTKKTEEKTPEQEAELAALETTVRPIAPIHAKAGADQHTLSHNWQPGSPAIDSNVMNEHGLVSPSIMDKIDTKENIKAREESERATSFYYEDEPEDCSKRDVSDPLYCQPGSERHKAFVKKSK